MATAGRHLARRLVEIGASDVFGVPGDFNLVLLDELLAEPKLRFIGCCNELNAGYAADGYARAKGVGACVVTFTVGSLSVINAIAGSFSESLPVICIVGGPNSNDYGSSRILHHTIGDPDFTQELHCFKQITCAQVVVKDMETAHEMIDFAITTALKNSKPVYMSICCNLPAIPHRSFSWIVPYSIPEKISNQRSLETAVDRAAEFLNTRTAPVIVAGAKLRVANAKDGFLRLANESGYAIALMPSAKGLFPESHPHFIGTYWGPLSSPFCTETVESADGYLFAGPVFNDYSSVGYTTQITKENAVFVQPDRVTLGDGVSFGCILMADFLNLLATKVRKNSQSYENFLRLRDSPKPEDGAPPPASGSGLTVAVLYSHIQKMLTKDSAVIADSGDAWFNCEKLKLPDGCGYEIQMQYGSIGWSVGALLGYSQGAKEKRPIACIGDGSFQATAQDVSTMIRYGQRSIIFQLNNGGYTIEVEIHDGPYNVIKNWNYTKVVEAFHNNEGKCWTAKIRTEAELVKALETAQGEKQDHLCFLECIIGKHDTSKELPEWGKRVSAANARPPNPQ